MATQDQIVALWGQSRTFRDWPQGVVPVPQPIQGTAFFPGGHGLLLDGTGKTPTTMVVGQDFNTMATYEKARQSGSEFDSSTTWRNIRIVFPQLGLALRECFFTNFYMGLREHGPETGRFPGARDPAFVQCCTRFFESQIEVIKPRLILTLGLAPLQAIAKEIFHLPAPKTLAACDGIYQGLPAAHGSVSLVALTHPSLYFANIRRRRYLGHQGLAAERAMIQQAESRSRSSL